MLTGLYICICCMLYKRELKGNHIFIENSIRSMEMKFLNFETRNKTGHRGRNI